MTVVGGGEGLQDWDMLDMCVDDDDADADVEKRDPPLEHERSFSGSGNHHTVTVARFGIGFLAGIK